MLNVGFFGKRNLEGCDEEDVKDLIGEGLKDYIKNNNVIFHLCLNPGTDCIASEFLLEKNLPFILHLPFEQDVALYKIHWKWYDRLKKVVDSAKGTIIYAYSWSLPTHKHNLAFSNRNNGFLACLDELVVIHDRNRDIVADFMIESGKRLSSDRGYSLKKVRRIVVEKDEDLLGL